MQKLHDDFTIQQCVFSILQRKRVFTYPDLDTKCNRQSKVKKT